MKGLIKPRQIPDFIMSRFQRVLSRSMTLTKIYTFCGSFRLLQAIGKQEKEGKHLKGNFNNPEERWCWLEKG